MPLLKPRADLIGILEAAYAAEPDDQVWARELGSALRSCVGGALQTGLIGLAHGDDLAGARIAFSGGTDVAWSERAMAMSPLAGGLPPALVQAYFYPGTPCITAAELDKSLPAEARAAARASRQGAADAFAMFAYPQQGVAAVLWTMLETVKSLGRGERAAFQRVAAHVDSALRLRMRPDSTVAAVLAPSGKLLDLEAPELERIQRSFAAKVVGIEQSRRRAQRTTPSALDAWQALVAGKYSLIPREDGDGKRFYELVTNASGARAHARLSSDEVEVLTLAARGVSGKGAAYALGFTESRVSTNLGQAAAKLGLRSRAELIRVAALLLGTVSPDPAATPLSPSEREILKLLRRGLSNAEIAALRSSSRHTVANQVSSILRKTSTRSRRGLAVRGAEP